jgi:GMP synthase-like glutamine amidotransferase
MGSLETSPPRIAILLNGFASTLTPAIRTSFISAISSAFSLSSLSSSSPPKIDFYDPIVAQIYPDPAEYNLIVLSGGTADPMGSQPWVLKMQEFLRTTSREWPEKKIVGICWGHQTMCVSFGGKVGNREGGAEVGVTPIILTDKGKKMLPFAGGDKLMIHEYHRREIKVPAKGFVALAEGNQMFMNERKTVWTFQGHPEMNAELAKSLLADTPAYMGVGGEEREELGRRMERWHDGVNIWKNILEWVGEE